jgi:hypothetical protein
LLCEKLLAVLAMALAESLELGSVQVRAVGVAGLLHDLGKVQVSKDVLLKPGKLTEAERGEIQRHPVEGARILLAGEQPLDPCGPGVRIVTRGTRRRPCNTSKRGPGSSSIRRWRQFSPLRRIFTNQPLSCLDYVPRAARA